MHRTRLGAWTRTTLSRMTPATRFKRALSFKSILSYVLLTCVAFFVVGTIHWPLVGDASLMHYVVFLMQHGMAPYRDIVDMNMPGSYLVEWAQMRVFGPGAMGLRLFDLSLMGVAALAMVAITWPQDWFAGVYAAALLLLIHGRDGVDQMAERDLTMTVLLLVGYAFLFHALRRQTENPPRSLLWAMALSGACFGIAATLKPTVVPLEFVLLALLAWQSNKNRQPRSTSVAALIGSSLSGFAIPFAIALFFLAREHALHAFWSILTGLVPYHASIGRLPIRYFLRYSIRPGFSPLAVLCAGIAAARKDWRNNESLALWIGFAFGLLSLVAQGKGYPYHRYPSEAFLLLLAGLNFTAALQRPGLLRVAGMLGLCFGVLLLAPVSTAKTLHYDWKNQEFITLLQGDLNALGSANLSGRVQCLDTTAGCINTLYQMRLVQDTGFLYDCYFFAPQPSPAQAQLREQFWIAIQSKPPEVFVVTNQMCVSPASGYGKLDAWPQFQHYLDANYSLYAQRTATRPVRWWSHPRPPFGYRIYMRK